MFSSTAYYSSLWPHIFCKCLVLSIVPKVRMGSNSTLHSCEHLAAGALKGPKTSLTCWVACYSSEPSGNFAKRMSFSSATVHVAASALTRIRAKFQAICESNWPNTHRLVDRGARIARIPSPQATSQSRPSEAKHCKAIMHKGHTYSLSLRKEQLVQAPPGIGGKAD